MQHATPVKPELTKQHIDKAIGELEVLLEEDLKPQRQRVVVLAQLDHLKDYGHNPTRELVYGCSFPVSEGDAVICPRTPLYQHEFVGVVISLDASTHPYKGPVKNLLRKA